MESGGSTNGGLVVAGGVANVREDQKEGFSDAASTPRGTVSYYASDTKSNGTSSMLNHIEKQCKKIVRQEDLKQKTLSFKPSVDGDTNRGLVPVAFSVEACRKALAEMLVIDELPFKFVENEGFRRFLHVAVPRWTNLPNRNTIKEEILKVYESEKAKLKRSLRGQRVCLTTDAWTSCQNLNYMCLTAHFIDGDYNYQKRVLNFGVVESHKGEALGRVLEDWLHDWHLDRILTITVDNASSNNLLINYIKRRTTHRSETLLKHEYLHMRCCAHILNLIVREGLKEYDASIAKIRTAVKYVRSSPRGIDFSKNVHENNKSRCSMFGCYNPVELYILDVGEGVDFQKGF